MLRFREEKSILSGCAEVQCSSCSKHITVDADEMDVQQVGADDRQMGLELLYEGEFTFTCPGCKSRILVRYIASEYPIGISNFSETYAEGAEVITCFEDLDLCNFHENYYQQDESEGLWLPDNKIITNLNVGVSMLIKEVSRQPSLLYDISPRQFEELLAHIFAENGFTVELTKKTRDGGRDIVAIRSDLGIRCKYLIECKRYAKDNPVTVELVRSLYGVQMQEGANKSVLATTSRFTPDALIFAKTTHTTEWSMDLKDFHDICHWLKVTS